MAELTKQEELWSGSFGDSYIERNTIAASVPPQLALFAKILQSAVGVRSILELGANIGINMVALKLLLPEVRFSAVEINKTAFERLSLIEGLDATLGSLYDYRPSSPVDLAFTNGVLIHLAPERLVDAYRTLYESSTRYILVSEYYNPTPVEVSYHGHSGAMFKRDWAGELMDLYPDLTLVDYGFHYRRDPVFPFDDLNWFLMEKRSTK